MDIFGGPLFSLPQKVGSEPAKLGVPPAPSTSKSGRFSSPPSVRTLLSVVWELPAALLPPVICDATAAQHTWSSCLPFRVEQGCSPLLFPLCVSTFTLPKGISQGSPEKQNNRISVYIDIDITSRISICLSVCLSIMSMSIPISISISISIYIYNYKNWFTQ